MSSEAQQFLKECLLFDARVNKLGHLYAPVAIYHDRRLIFGPEETIGPRQLTALDEFCAPARYVLGHDIIARDILRPKEATSGLAIFDKPLIDTLYLSPLAHPENPYHRLIKDDRLVSGSGNNPVEDLLTIGQVFFEQWQALTARLGDGNDTPILYRSFLQNDPALAGTTTAMEAMGIQALTGNDLIEAFSWFAAEHCCATALQSVVDQLTDDAVALPQFAYITAWLSVSGGNSVLPPWVRHRFPDIPSILNLLRNTPCQSSRCNYCQQHRKTHIFLRKSFAFDDFRSKPAYADGKSLQDQIVTAAAGDASLFAALPSEEAKSRCYLTPALMRHKRRNILTIIFLPLQALTKDKAADFSRLNGSATAAVVYGLHPPQEQRAVLENVRLGTVGLLFVSPEQLQNKSFINTIRQREIGAWVFDEAHCLARSSRDFHPDYLLAIRFIKEFSRKENCTVAAVQCFTAHASQGIETEIVNTIQDELGLTVLSFAGDSKAATAQPFNGEDGSDISANISTSDNKNDEPATNTAAHPVVRTPVDGSKPNSSPKKITLSAIVGYKTSINSETALTRTCALENDFLKMLVDTVSDGADETPPVLDLRLINRRLIELGHPNSTPSCLRLILFGLNRDTTGMIGENGSLSLLAVGRDCFSLRLKPDFTSLIETVKIRQQAAFVALRVILAPISPQTKSNAHLSIRFTLAQIIEALTKDPILSPQLKNPPAAAERALTFMHEQSVIELQQSLTKIRQAMTIDGTQKAAHRSPEPTGSEPQNRRHEPDILIHGADRPSKRPLTLRGAARKLIGACFKVGTKDVTPRAFLGGKKSRAEALAQRSRARLVDDLQNPDQERIVSAPVHSNMLVIAGPASGKTRVVAHRIAYLLRVERVPASSILILCFHRNAALRVRRKVRDLIGDDVRGVTALTFHGLALRLIGGSLVPREKKHTEVNIDFASIIPNTISLLRGEREAQGVNGVGPRDILAGKYRHIMIDEYQNIDTDHYELISLLTGRNLEKGEDKPTILAVGDDDLNICRFQRENVTFFRQFHQEYSAELHYLTRNYRSTSHIIAACNCLITANSDRMKNKHPITINEARGILPSGGHWQFSDPLNKGRVQVIEIADASEQAVALLEEIRRLQGLENRFKLSDCAILAREKQELDLIRSLFEENDIPFSLNWCGDSFPSLSKIREYADLLADLRADRGATRTADTLLSFLPGNKERDTIRQTHLRRLIEEWREDTGDLPQPVVQIEAYLYEALSERCHSLSHGNGVVLSTVHSAKDLKFDHVFILGDNWLEKQGVEMEEERRLYYTAMSRAGKTLILMVLHTRHNPHVCLLAGDFIMRRTVQPQKHNTMIYRRYELLGMQELQLEYGSFFAENQPIHQALTHCMVGDPLSLQAAGNHLDLLDTAGVAVARLSEAAASLWRPHLAQVEAVRIVAMVRVSATDISRPEHAGSRQCESWEIPICEVIVRTGKDDPTTKTTLHEP